MRRVYPISDQQFLTEECDPRTGEYYLGVCDLRDYRPKACFPSRWVWWWEQLWEEFDLKLHALALTFGCGFVAGAGIMALVLRFMRID